MIVNVINLSADQPIDPYANPQLKERIAHCREGRVLSVAAQSKLHGFAVRFWPGNTEDNVFRCGNISRAFKKIVQYAKEERLGSVTIAEDDFQLTSRDSWTHYIKNIPKDFDIYSAGIYAGKIEDSRIVNGYSGNTLITVHERFYDFFLTADETKHLDRWLGEFCMEKKYFVCLPFVVKQIHGYSDNHRKMQTYETYEQDWKYL